MSDQNTAKLNMWVRVDGLGNFVNGTNESRPFGIIPKDGKWVQIQKKICCASTDSIIIFSNTTASANITAIQSSDGRINLTGLNIANGQYLAVVLPNGYDYSFTVTTTTFSGRTMTNSEIYHAGSDIGTISSPGALTSTSTSFTVSAAVSNQYLSILS